MKLTASSLAFIVMNEMKKTRVDHLNNTINTLQLVRLRDLAAMYCQLCSQCWNDFASFHCHPWPIVHFSMPAMPGAEHGQAEAKDVTRLSFRVVSVMKTSRRRRDVLCDASAVLCAPIPNVLTYLVKICVFCHFLVFNNNNVTTDDTTSLV